MQNSPNRINISLEIIIWLNINCSYAQITISKVISNQQLTGNNFSNKPIGNGAPLHHISLSLSALLFFRQPYQRVIYVMKMKITYLLFVFDPVWANNRILAILIPSAVQSFLHNQTQKVTDQSRHIELLHHTEKTWPFYNTALWNWLN